MSCPNCGTEAFTTANFCRLCGHRLKELPAAIASTSPPDLARAIRKLIVGVGLLIVAFVPLLEGEPMIWWLLFPGVPMIVKGMRLLAQANVARCVQSPNPPVSITSPTAPIQGRISSDVRVRPTGELTPPPGSEPCRMG